MPVRLDPAPAAGQWFRSTTLQRRNDTGRAAGWLGRGPRSVGLSLAVAVAALAAACSAGAADPPRQVDLLLRGGRILDGSGGPEFIGDVGIAGDRIVAVGKFAFDGDPHEIDCRGWVIAPGWIDLHNHSDKQILTPELRANVNYLIQGCTTIVTGNCGGGPVDVKAYYDAIERHGAGTNVAHLLPQGDLRKQVVGTVDRRATEDELQQMLALTERAMQDGAWGMSSGLIYVPSSYADTEELVALAERVGRHGGIYASHIRNEGVELLAAIDEILEIERRGKLPVHVSHFKSSGRDAWGLVREAARVLAAAREAGRRVTADQYPYIASSTSLEATLLPASARAGGRSQLTARLQDPQTGAALKQKVAATLRKKDDGHAIKIASCQHRPAWVGKSLREIAEAEETSALEIALEILQNGGAKIVNFSMNELDVRHVMQLSWVATASDGRADLPSADRPHPRFFGTFARKIGYYSLREEVLSLAQAVRSASGLPADILQLPRRGYLRPGYFADLVVFDPQEYIDTATFERPHGYAKGTRYVLVNGTLAVAAGTPTGALGGKALRHRSAESASAP